LNLHRVSDIRHIEIHTAESLEPDPNPFEVETAIAKLKTYRSQGSVQILAEVIHAGSETLQSEIHKLVNYILNNEELPDQWKESILVPIHKKGDKTDLLIIMGYHCYQLHTKFYPISFSQG
jgi:hypothetical protein